MTDPRDVITRQVFETDQDRDGYSVRAFYTQDTRWALGEIQHNRGTVMRFPIAAYRVWNLHAHAIEVISDARTELDQAAALLELMRAAERAATESFKPCIHQRGNP